MAHIYTKTGDRGETGLRFGKRVLKSSARIAAIGDIDELNAAIGLLRAIKSDAAGNDEMLGHIQNDLFEIGADLANIKEQQCSITEAKIAALERFIDACEEKLPPLTHFILPGGTEKSARAHLARAICRRAERSLIALNEKEPLPSPLLIYINRLSDLLFMIARSEMFAAGEKEMPWKRPF